MTATAMLTGFTEAREGVDGAVRTLRCISAVSLEDDMLLRFSQPPPVLMAGGR